MRQRVRAVIGVTLFSFALPSTAQACRCISSAFEARAARARLIVLGRVVETIGESQVIVAVDERFKGSVETDTLTLQRTNSSCEYFTRTPNIGERYLLLVGTHNGPFTVGRCAGSGPPDERAVELRWLRSPRRRAG